MNSIIFSMIAACLSIGGVLIAVGVFKARINHNADVNKAQDEQMKILATKEELAAAIRRSDEMLSIMTKRAEEDRAKGQGQYREFYSLLNGQERRVIALETQQTALAKSFDELKQDIKAGFRDVQAELKELQNEIKAARKQG